MNDDQIHALARRRVAMKRGFAIHATVYVAVNLLLVAIDLLGPGAHRWSVWPLLGWGIGLAAHGLSTWVFLPGNQRSARAFEREVEQLRAQRSARG